MNYISKHVLKAAWFYSSTLRMNGVVQYDMYVSLINKTCTKL
jgi:hypothetical protein